MREVIATVVAGVAATAFAWSMVDVIGGGVAVGQLAVAVGLVVYCWVIGRRVKGGQVAEMRRSVRLRGVNAV